MIEFLHGKYLGGYPNIPKAQSGNLIFTDSNMVITGWRKPRVSVRAIAISAIEIEGEQEAKGRGGAALMLGVGALAAKGSTIRTVLTVHMLSGRSAIFVVDKVSPTEVKGKLSAWMSERGITWHPVGETDASILPETEAVGA